MFDHVGGPGIADSWRLLRRGGTLVSYGTAATKDDAGRSQLPGPRARRPAAAVEPPAQRPARALLQLLGRSAPRRRASSARLRDDLTQVLDLLAAGALTAQVAARIPLVEAGSALALAESHTVSGKVVLIP